MSTTSLQPEEWRLVAAYLPQLDLKRISFTCSQLWGVCREQLWRDPEFDENRFSNKRQIR